MKIKTIVTLYIVIEIILLSINYLFIKFGNDLLFSSLDKTIIGSVIIGIILVVNLIVLRIKLLIDVSLFLKLIGITFLGISLPFLFLFLILSKLH